MYSANPCATWRDDWEVEVGLETFTAKSHPQHRLSRWLLKPYTVCVEEVVSMLQIKKWLLIEE